MVKAHLAILLIGLSANQAFTSDDDRERHWAEGVYFPPIIAPSATQNNTLPLEPSSMQQIRRNPWPADGNYHSLNPHPTPQSLGYPVDGYNPYRPSESGVHKSFPGHANEYVPKDYSPSTSKEYRANKDRNGYRVNGFGITEDNSRNEYRTRYNGHAAKRYRDQRQDGPYRRADEAVDSDYRGKKYPHQYGLDIYPEAGSSNESPSHERQMFSSISGNIPYHADWNAEQIVDESRTLQIPWELMWPLPNSDLPLYPLW